MDGKDITYEYCPHCDTEVELTNTFGIHKCPNCGKWIVACSLCLCNEMGVGCSECILEKQAKYLNEEDKAISDYMNQNWHDICRKDQN